MLLPLEDPEISDVRSLAQAVLTKVKFILLKAKVLWLFKFSFEKTMRRYYYYIRYFVTIF